MDIQGTKATAETNSIFEPHIFRDGRAGHYWIAFEGDIDGPFESYEDAEHTFNRVTHAAVCA